MSFFVGFFVGTILVLALIVFWDWLTRIIYAFQERKMDGGAGYLSLWDAKYYGSYDGTGKKDGTIGF